MKQYEKDLEASSSVVRIDGTARRPAPGEPVREIQLATVRLKEMERVLLSGEQRHDELLERFQALEVAVQALSVRYASRQQENEEAILEVARSFREHFEDYHRLKADVLGLSAHVDRWTKRLERMLKVPPVRWVQRLRKRI